VPHPPDHLGAELEDTADRIAREERLGDAVDREGGVRERRLLWRAALGVRLGLGDGAGQASRGVTERARRAVEQDAALLISGAAEPEEAREGEDRPGGVQGSKRGQGDEEKIA
jgi:hypothetical protein